jgi:hypothetical protein
LRPVGGKEIYEVPNYQGRYILLINCTGENKYLEIKYNTVSSQLRTYKF